MMMSAKGVVNPGAQPPRLVRSLPARMQALPAEPAACSTRLVLDSGRARCCDELSDGPAWRFSRHHVPCSRPASERLGSCAAHRCRCLSASAATSCAAPSGHLECVQGQMPLADELARRLNDCYASQVRRPRDVVYQYNGCPHPIGGTWFCPGCGVRLREDSPGDLPPRVRAEPSRVCAQHRREAPPLGSLRVEPALFSLATKDRLVLAVSGFSYVCEASQTRNATRRGQGGVHALALCCSKWGWARSPSAACVGHQSRRP